ncbi:hypothetical protein M885DRAFT_616128 [Pelagophyceae sp. CCMP2097]|nr:hypothetical protein M885DRAFT_616128 [Pelagophyceae sp. CCMP2097]
MSAPQREPRYLTVEGNFFEEPDAGPGAANYDVSRLYDRAASPFAGRCTFGNASRDDVRSYLRGGSGGAEAGGKSARWAANGPGPMRYEGRAGFGPMPPVASLYGAKVEQTTKRAGLDGALKAMADQVWLAKRADMLLAAAFRHEATYRPPLRAKVGKTAKAPRFENDPAIVQAAPGAYDVRAKFAAVSFVSEPGSRSHASFSIGKSGRQSFFKGAPDVPAAAVGIYDLKSVKYETTLAEARRVPTARPYMLSGEPRDCIPKTFAKTARCASAPSHKGLEKALRAMGSAEDLRRLTLDANEDAAWWPNAQPGSPWPKSKRATRPKTGQKHFGTAPRLDGVPQGGSSAGASEPGPGSYDDVMPTRQPMALEWRKSHLRGHGSELAKALDKDAKVEIKADAAARKARPSPEAPPDARVPLFDDAPPDYRDFMPLSPAATKFLERSAAYFPTKRASAPSPAKRAYTAVASTAGQRRGTFPAAAKRTAVFETATPLTSPVQAGAAAFHLEGAGT